MPIQPETNFIPAVGAYGSYAFICNLGQPKMSPVPVCLQILGFCYVCVLVLGGIANTHTHTHTRTHKWHHKWDLQHFVEILFWNFLFLKQSKCGNRCPIRYVAEVPLYWPLIKKHHGKWANVVFLNLISKYIQVVFFFFWEITKNLSEILVPISSLTLFAEIFSRAPWHL